MINCFLSILSFGSRKLVCPQLSHGSFIASDNVAPLTLPANQCEQVALLHSLKLVH
jgi:hypothetical protein